ncbi:unnamed protein product [Lathyrus sativus]|nr:unnamed protein product [Lathyrus sativus]
MIPKCGLGRGTPSMLAGEEENIGASTSAPQPVGFPGGSYVTSLLVKYKHLVARHLCSSEERGPKKELEVVGHGQKLT